MKIDRHGQAKILTLSEIDILFNRGLNSNFYRALFGICLYTACRIRECCLLRTTDVYECKGIVMPEIVFRKGNTKGKLATRCIPVIEDLRLLLKEYYPSKSTWFLFPGLDGTGHINPDSAARVLRKACQEVGIRGASTHSFRRTALTQLSNAGIPLRVIQEISGHRNLEQLQRYLEVKPEQILGAVSALSMLSPVGKRAYLDRNNADTTISERTSIRDRHPDLQ
ncbi:tyrosine-type recombinase/integrase [Limnofasciculus baicalensis]|uniref:Site-specific integrase n=1 Tax=Limnofasciculus baicalensis BBK-W-15 TaxID=2699891 RepID=A0AAE3GUL3_9CYAN|nr:tyrosine-type recombinase/integrase [Limnofasciculus baicalensis]MCP2730985.1 site-specific integrase [Limnofasciculus baicalensis BBK-W-15]